MSTLRRSLARAFLISALSPLLLVATHEFRVAALLVAGSMFAVALWDQLR